MPFLNAKSNFKEFSNSIRFFLFLKGGLGMRGEELICQYSVKLKYTTIGKKKLEN